MNFNRLRLASIATLAALLTAPLASAQISALSEDFESLDQMSGTALGDAGWQVFANIFEADGTTFAYNYGAFPAPNGSGAFSNVADGEGGPDQGAQQLVTFSDYNNTDQSTGRVHETLVFQEQTVAVGDAGVWVFSFDAKKGDLAGASTANAFVKTLDPGAGFATTSIATIDTTALPATWGRFQIAVNISDAQAGQLVQVGFQTRAANFEASGVLYDNVDFDRFSGGIIPVYSKNFEALDAMSGTALGDDGWQVFANIFEADGTTFAYNYGAFPAPNGSGAFSNVAVGEGGLDQGAQQLVTFSDYNNTDQSTGRVHETIVFLERTVTAGDAGSWVFEFDAKDGDLAGASTARAFVKTLDPGAGFATTSIAAIDTTSLPGTWGTFQIAVNLGAGQAGQLLQVGFETRAANFEPSGVLYDNISFGPLGDAADYIYDGDITLCTGTCESFAALELGSTVVGALSIDVAPSSSFTIDNIVSYNFEITSTATLEPYNGANPATANPLPIDSNIAVLEPTGFGGLTTGGTTDASGELDSGTLLFRFLNPPFSSNDAWVIIDIATGQAQVCLFFAVSGCLPGATEAVVVNGSFSLDTGFVDSDGDGVGDDVDNCTTRANASQLDTDGDGHGNICDGDFDNNCIVNAGDLGIFRTLFFQPGNQGDLDGNGIANATDLGIFRTLFFMPPGPSAAGLCTPM